MTAPKFPEMYVPAKEVETPNPVTTKVKKQTKIFFMLVQPLNVV
jgi:hypothetical protein